jgi:hypothetical protein
MWLPAIAGEVRSVAAAIAAARIEEIFFINNLRR